MSAPNDQYIYLHKVDGAVNNPYLKNKNDGNLQNNLAKRQGLYRAIC
jgi:hypothetical protein